MSYTNKFLFLIQENVANYTFIIHNHTEGKCSLNVPSIVTPHYTALRSVIPNLTSKFILKTVTYIQVWFTTLKELWAFVVQWIKQKEKSQTSIKLQTAFTQNTHHKHTHSELMPLLLSSSSSSSSCVLCANMDFTCVWQTMVIRIMLLFIRTYHQQSINTDMFYIYIYIKTLKWFLKKALKEGFNE